MYSVIRNFLLSIIVLTSLIFAGITFEITSKTDNKTPLSNKKIQSLIVRALNLENCKVPYFKALVHTYTGLEGEAHYFVVYLNRSDMYSVKVYRIDMEKDQVSAVIEDYVEEDMDSKTCYSCPDPEVVALYSTCITEFPSARAAIEYAVQVSEKLGIKTKALYSGEENPTNIQNYLACPKLKIWARVGHGNTQLIQVSGGNLTSTFFLGLGTTLRGRLMIFNSCLVHNNPFEPSIMAAGTYFFAGGDKNLVVGISEGVFKAFIKKALDEKMELNAAFTAAEKEIGYYDYGWSGDPSGPPHYFTGTTKQYMQVSLPAKGAQWDRGSFNATQWESNVDGNVKIDLLKGWVFKKTLVASTPSDGKEIVEMDNALELGNDYTIKVTSVKYDTVVDQSEQFSVTQGVIVSAFPFSLTFDEFLGLPNGWVQSQGDDLEWILNSGPTPSRKGVGCVGDKTGPTKDHTTGDDWYYYVNANGDGHSPGKEASLLTSKYDMTKLSNPMLSFWVHMYSAIDSMGVLFLDINVNGEWKNDIIRINGNQGDAWFQVKQNLTDFVSNRTCFRIRAITGANWCSDIAIDDFKLSSEISPVQNQQAPGQSFAFSYKNSYIEFTMPVNTPHIQINLYSMQGKLIRQLFNGRANAGQYACAVQDAGKMLPAGTYLCNLKTGVLNKTLVITKSE
jgi:hypothetical protein